MMRKYMCSKNDSIAKEDTPGPELKALLDLPHAPVVTLNVPSDYIPGDYIGKPRNPWGSGDRDKDTRWTDKYTWWTVEVPMTAEEKLTMIRAILADYDSSYSFVGKIRKVLDA